MSKQNKQGKSSSNSISSNDNLHVDYVEHISSSFEYSLDNPLTTSSPLHNRTPHRVPDNNQGTAVEVSYLLGDNSEPNNSFCSSPFLEVTVVEASKNTICNSPATRRRGRLPKALSLSKLAEKFKDTPIIAAWARGTKRHPSQLADSIDSQANPLAKRKKRSGTSLGYNFSPHTKFTTKGSLICPSLAFTVSDGSNMQDILDAIKAMDTKLNNINTNVNSLNNLYTILNNRIEESDRKQEDRWMLVERRLNELEEAQRNLPQLNNLQELKQDIQDLVRSEVNEKLRDEVNTALAKVDDDMAGNVNRVLEELDAANRKVKKLNLVVRGLNDENQRSEQAIKTLFSRKFDLNEGIVEIEIDETSPRAIVTMASWEIKQKILRNKKSALKNSSIYIDPDLTDREQKIAAKLRSFAREKRAEGANTRLGFLKVQVNGQWFNWDELRDIPVPCRPLRSRQGNTVVASNSRTQPGSLISTHGSQAHMSSQFSS